jgi:hypothetical protein
MYWDPHLNLAQLNDNLNTTSNLRAPHDQTTKGLRYILLLARHMTGWIIRQPQYCVYQSRVAYIMSNFPFVRLHPLKPPHGVSRALLISHVTL